MKLILMLFLIAAEFSIVNSSNQINIKKKSEKFSLVNRKTSVNSKGELMLVGFWKYSKNGGDTPTSYNASFYVHFIKEESSPFFQKLNTSISVNHTNLTIIPYNVSCVNHTIYNKSDGLKDVSYFCSVNVQENFFYFTPKIDFILFNDTTNPKKYTEDTIDKSSIVDETINGYDNYWNHDLNYNVFDLHEIELKENEFTLKGNFSKSYEGKQIYLNISGVDNYTITNNSIIFNATGIINDHLHGKMPNSSDGTPVLFYAKSNVDDSLHYPISNEYIEVVGFGNYKPATQNADARNQLFFTGTQYSLNELEKYVRFNVTIKYNGLRNLQEQKDITATGILANIDNENDFATYNVSYPNTANKNIISMTVPTKFEFSVNNETYTKIDENIYIPSDLNLTNTENVTVERIEYLSLPDTSTSNSLSFDFNVSKLNLRDDKTAYLSYYPFNMGDRKEIKCYIENKTLPYRISCSPKQYIYTQMNTLKFIIPEIKSSSRRLRSLSTETNRTIYPPTNYSGIMEYEYNPTGNVFSRKTASNGLSAGAIVAIVLATVAAVACVALAFFFLNRVKVTPPPIKTPTDVNFANTSTYINH
jgi:hypothetical protein